MQGRTLRHAFSSPGQPDEESSSDDQTDQSAAGGNAGCVFAVLIGIAVVIIVGVASQCSDTSEPEPRQRAPSPSEIQRYCQEECAALGMGQTCVNSCIDGIYRRLNRPVENPARQDSLEYAYALIDSGNFDEAWKICGDAIINAQSSESAAAGWLCRAKISELEGDAVSYDFALRQAEWELSNDLSP